ncbi:MAG: DUF4147 domain-containing protein [Planctomycetaceae bacterium]|nr:DUF4147 domain-containing protein [Planctomycetaceae bacterium]
MHAVEAAIEIWNAGVAAVDSERLVRQHLQLTPTHLIAAETAIPLAGIRRLVVVGAGKAGAGMARGAEAALTDLPSRIERTGWVNVPEDCLQRLDWIHLHGARPPGLNEPTSAAVEGTRQILHLTGDLGNHDVCLLLLSGGGSALLCSPIDGVPLEDKLQVTRLLASAGAPIQDLNLVRTWLSQVKGGGFAARCPAGHLIALIISDVIGDPLETIASGPTISRASTSATALQLLRNYAASDDVIPQSVLQTLQQGAVSLRNHLHVAGPQPARRVVNRIIGNNQTAVHAAAKHARQLGFQVIDGGSAHTGEAAAEGAAFLRQLQTIRDTPRTETSSSLPSSAQPVCLINGGEPTVRLASIAWESGQTRRGGRNQEFVLGAIAAQPDSEAWRDMCVLSGGTDGEDGPTDAAGAFADAELVRRSLQLQLNPSAFLAINNSYPFFESTHGLLLTGPTHTNVMDLRVGIVLPS